MPDRPPDPKPGDPAADPPKPPVEGGKEHETEPGQWAGAVAIKFGYADWKKDVWMHPRNAKLREIRPDPRLLVPKDIVFVPPWADAPVKVANGEERKFILKTPSEVLRLRLLDEDGEPFRDSPYEVVELKYGKGGGGYVQQKFQTDGDGVLCETIPSTTKKGVIRLTREEVLFEFTVGHVLPAIPFAPEELEPQPDLSRPQSSPGQRKAQLEKDGKIRIMAVQQRLKNLGYYTGKITDEMNPEMRLALANFQEFCAQNSQADVQGEIPHAGPVSGDLTPATLEAIVKFYGC